MKEAQTWLLFTSCAVTKHVQYTLLLYIRKATVYNNYRSFAVVPIPRGYAVTLIGFVSFADQNHAPGLSDVRPELQGSTLYTVCLSSDAYTIFI